MKKSVESLVLVMLLSSCASVPDSAAVGDPASTAAEIARLEERWTVAFNSHDTQFIESVMAPEFVVVGSGGTQRHTVTTRADWMRVWLGPEQHPYEAKVLTCR